VGGLIVGDSKVIPQTWAAACAVTSPRLGNNERIASFPSCLCKEAGANDKDARDRTIIGEIGETRCFVPGPVCDEPCPVGAVNNHHNNFDGAVDDSFGCPGDSSGCCLGNSGAAQGRCGVHKL